MSAKVPEDEHVLVLIDGSSDGSVKFCLLFGRKAMYYVEPGEFFRNRVQIPYGRIDTSALSVTDNYWSGHVLVDGSKISGFGIPPAQLGGIIERVVDVAG